MRHAGDVIAILLHIGGGLNGHVAGPAGFRVAGHAAQRIGAVQQRVVRSVVVRARCGAVDAHPVLRQTAEGVVRGSGRRGDAHVGIHISGGIFPRGRGLARHRRGIGQPAVRRIGLCEGLDDVENGGGGSVRNGAGDDAVCGLYRTAVAAHQYRALVGDGKGGAPGSCDGNLIEQGHLSGVRRIGGEGYGAVLHGDSIRQVEHGAAWHGCQPLLLDIGNLRSRGRLRLPCKNRVVMILPLLISPNTVKVKAGMLAHIGLISKIGICDVLGADCTAACSRNPGVRD